MLDKLKFEIQGDDFREGLTAIVSVKVAEPQFEGQTKTKLGNTEVRGIVDTLVGEALGEYLEFNPGVIDLILEKAIQVIPRFLQNYPDQMGPVRRNMLGLCRAIAKWRK